MAEWPKDEYDLSYDLVFCYIPNTAVTGVYGRISIISHYKNAVSRDLMRKCHIIYAPVIAWDEVRFTYSISIDVYPSIILDIYNIVAGRDDSFDEDMVIAIEGDDVAFLDLCIPRYDDKVSLLQCLVHRRTTHFQDWKEEHRYQYGHSYDKRKYPDSICKKPEEPVLILQSFQFFLHD